MTAPWTSLCALALAFGLPTAAGCGSDGSSAAGGSTQLDGAAGGGADSGPPGAGGSAGRDGGAADGSSGAGAPSDGGGARDGGGAAGGSVGVDPADAGNGLFDGPAGEWRWVGVPGSKCGDGSQTGIAYSRGTEPAVLVYLEAGGVCPDANCTSSPHYVWTGYDEADFREALAGSAAAHTEYGKPGINVSAAGLFDRSGPVNPFRNWSFVYVPYCTGDYFIGDSEFHYPARTMHFRGSRNVKLFFSAVAAGFPDVDRAFLMGGSAGSVGAMKNYWQLLEAYPGKRVDLASDSLNLIAGYGNKPEYRYPDTNPQEPPSCATCASDYKTMYEHNARLAAGVGGRVAVVESRGNITLVPVCWLQGCDYAQGLRNLGEYLDPLPNVKYYVADNTAHVLSKYALDAPFIAAREPVAGSLQTDTHHLSEFLARMVNDDPGWRSISVLRSDPLPCATGCTGRTCGSDACGGVCGTCAADQTCDVGVVGGWCAP